MKRILYILLIPFLLLNCKKEKEPAPLPAIQEIVGIWRLDAMEKTVNGQKVWEKFSTDPPFYLVFRFDGLPLDGEELSWCCAPETLVLNGIPFKIKPQAKVPSNPRCALINCYSCPSWDLEHNENELIITSRCDFMKYRHRYLRE